MAKKNKGLVIDGIAAAATIDTSGELIEIEGLDLTDFEEGLGVFNYEHRREKDAGASANDIVGRITYAKKIFKRSDCEDDRQRMYWDQIKVPFVYVKGELLDGQGHPGAVAMAAHIRWDKDHGNPILMRFSIEGQTLQREGNIIKRAVAKAVAITRKPANRACHSGVVEDPEDEKNPDNTLEQFFTMKFERPDEQRLSSVEFTLVPTDEPEDPATLLKASLERLRELSELSKTLTAGSYDAAPGTLSGGAALQVEDRSLKNRVLATYRDWDKKGSFRPVLKAALPEVDDSYIDYFTNIVDEFHLKKARDLYDRLCKAMVPEKIHDTTTQQPKILEPDDIRPAQPLTVQGKPRRPLSTIPNIPSCRFDPNKGILYTPMGSFKCYNPEEDTEPLPDNPRLTPALAFRRAMSDPVIQAYHQRAMRNWLAVRELIHEGKVPDSMIAHSAHFAIFSGNNPVHVQELMFGHLQDLLKETGLDPYSTDLGALKKQFLARSGTIPEHSREHFTDTLGNLIHTKGGQVIRFGKGSQLFDYVSRYAKDHEMFTDAVRRFGPDGRTAVKHLLDLKARGEAGLSGLGNKTTRFGYAMLGGGNTLIPDTHLIRNIFNLDQTKDAATINYLKTVLWHPKNIELLDRMDQWYMNHPAVRFVQQKYFDGRPTEEALFGGFWLHWMSIRGFEQALGRRNQISFVGVDHRPIWEADQEAAFRAGLGELFKAEVKAIPIWVRTAMAVNDLQRTHGAGALIAYFANYVPYLLTHAVSGPEPSDLYKAESEPVVPPQPKQYRFLGSQVEPGQIDLIDGAGNAYLSLPMLGSDEKYAYVVDGSETKRLDRAHEGVGFRVVRGPAFIQPSQVVDAAEHAIDVVNMTPEQVDLAHGYDFGTLANNWGVSGAGYHGYARPTLDYNHPFLEGLVPLLRELPSARREAIFYNIAREVFGLGQYVPVVAVVDHPQGGIYSVHRHVPGATPLEISRIAGWRIPNADHDTAYTLMKLGHQGILDQLALMDFVMAHRDRPDTHYLLTPGREPGIVLVGNGLIFAPDEPAVPKYLYRYHQLLEPSIHPEELHHVPYLPGVGEWIKDVSPNKLAELLSLQGVPESLIRSTVRRLMAAQKWFENPAPTKGIFLE